MSLRTTLPRSFRLNTWGVSLVLKRGRRLQSAARTTPPLGVLVTAKAVQQSDPSGQSARTPTPHARLAIAVPKRLMKSAVDRNRVKRWVREAFRQHDLRNQAVDVLITLNMKAALSEPQHREALRAAMQDVLGAAKKEAVRNRLPLAAIAATDLSGGE